MTTLQNFGKHVLKNLNATYGCNFYLHFSDFENDRFYAYIPERNTIRIYSNFLLLLEFGNIENFDCKNEFSLFHCDTCRDVLMCAIVLSFFILKDKYKFTQAIFNSKIKRKFEQLRQGNTGELFSFVDTLQPKLEIMTIPKINLCKN